nr:DMT family transporter [Cribrihabitans marinus]
MQVRSNNPAAGIAFVIAGVFTISVNDMLIKQLSGDYPLHQIVFTRSGIGLLFSLALVRIEGGWSILKTRQPGLHLLRGLLIVIANMTFFVALAALPIAEATALFFVAPLFITLLSVPILGERVGPMRLGAVLVGFGGVLLMQRPWQSGAALDVPRLVLLLPVLAALTYALMQLLTRKLGVAMKASALAVYTQGMFLAISVGFFLVAGDGRFATGTESTSLQFLLRAWTWPDDPDWPLFLVLGMNSAVVAYCLSAAYRMADAATVAPFEYVGLPLAVFWGWMIWSELPGWQVWLGMMLIVGAGLFVFLRERGRTRRPARAGLKARF